MDDHLTGPVRRSRAAAIYLRCYPRDAAGTEYQRTALEWFALQQGLSAPYAFTDDGCRSGGPLPELERLLRRVEQGWVDTVLVPGPFVFSLDDRASAATVRRLEELGCRVLELPGRAGRARPPAPRDSPDGHAARALAAHRPPALRSA
ncbi:recombinase family protein [Kitasatospora sp. RG8]|uniref:recombinase family protein n=1 Tax=Kitasatospora sp. RG8 TaxID=2820815 RepID=UPI001AE03F88|nr:recombinase family protein [Kitasatospora sp. RG8]MBP0455738.1 recombinase family protein [Kitasatospora sp. RG8]